MTEVQIGLARQLVAAKWWKWRHGMTWVTVFDDGEQADRAVVDCIHGAGEPPLDDALPDLTDDATGGVLLWMLPKTVIHNKKGSWSVRVLLHDGGATESPEFEGTTIAEACARALLELHGG